MPNDMVTARNRAPQTTGWISLIGFARSVHVHNSISVVYAKFDGLSCMVPGYRFWEGPIALQCFVHISDKKNSCNTKVVFNHFDRDSCIYIYVYIYIYIHIYGTGLQSPPLLWELGGLSPPPCGNGAGLLYGWMDGCLSVCMHAWMYVCTYVCMYVCI